MKTVLGMGCAASRWGLVLAVVGMAGLARAGDESPTAKATAEGRAIFLREWVAGPTEHGGDGLGPVFNDSSCVACHNAGGVGGGGPNSKNVDIITADNPIQISTVPDDIMVIPTPPRFLGRALGTILGIERSTPSTIPTTPGPAPDRTPLIQAHAGFRTASSVVLHRFSTEPEYEGWRLNLIGLGNFGGPGPMGGKGGPSGPAQAAAELQRLQMLVQNRVNLGQISGSAGNFTLTRSQRNPTALFGAGQIDRVTDEAIEARSQLRHEEFPEIAGRVARGKDGRVGRFGWKAQTPTLEDFVLTACAVELGLEVPGHPQGGLPLKPDYKPGGLDLTADECAALTAYVRSLPRPGRVNADHPEVAAGSRLFESVGCATCHAPKLGEVDGIYSDLLVHDLGGALGDVGQYGVFTPESSEPVIELEPEGPLAGAPATPAGAAARALDAPAPSAEPLQTPQVVAFTRVVTNMGEVALDIAPRPANGPAGRQEWRTPPLWGLRDSGPYLHDGRADNLDEAVALHGGEAARVARKYFVLTPAERRQLQTFLKSLTAPDPAALVQAGN